METMNTTNNLLTKTILKDLRLALGEAEANRSICWKTFQSKRNKTNSLALTESETAIKTAENNLTAFWLAREAEAEVSI